MSKELRTSAWRAQAHLIFCVSRLHYWLSFVKFLISYSFLLTASVIVEQIIETLHKKKLLNAQLLKLLMTAKLKTLCLSWIPEQDGNDNLFAEIFYQVSTRCTVITITCFFLSFTSHNFLNKFSNSSNLNAWNGGTMYTIAISSNNLLSSLSCFKTWKSWTFPIAM